MSAKLDLILDSLINPVSARYTVLRFSQILKNDFAALCPIDKLLKNAELAQQQMRYCFRSSVFITLVFVNFLALLLLAASLAYHIGEWCLDGWMCRQTVSNCYSSYSFCPLLVKLHTCCVCRYAHFCGTDFRNFAANFSNLTLGLSLWNSLNNLVSQN